MYIVIFCFGLLIGSFLNVVIYRFNTGLSFMNGRSKCFSCGRNLTPRDLIPVFSFLRYKGHCRVCKAKISIQYPLVELITACALTAVYSKYFISLTVMAGGAPFWVLFTTDVVLVCILICIGVYDLRHKIIPNRLVYLAALLAFIQMATKVFSSSGGTSDIVMGLLAGPILAAPFGFLWLISGGRWMGLGDAKLALVIGWMLGIAQGFTAVVYSFWIGTIVILGAIFLGEAVEAFSSKNNIFGIQVFKGSTGSAFRKIFPKLGLRSEIPFGPFMIIGLYIVYVTERTLLNLHFW